MYDTIRTVVLAALILLALMTGMVQAQGTRCADRALVADRLKALYGEQYQVTLIAQKSVFELWLNTSTATWTVIRIHPTGKTCIVGSGTGVITNARPQPPGNDL